MVGRNNIQVEPDVMPLRRRAYKPFEKQAREIAEGAGSDLVAWDILWTPATRPRIEYPKSLNRQTKITLESDWSPFRPKRKPKEYPHGWDTTGSKDTGRQDALSMPDPEGHKLPGSFWTREVNRMAFSTPVETHLDTAPLEEQALAGYTQHHNNVVADDGGMVVAEVWHSDRLSVPNIARTRVTRWAEWPAHRSGTWDAWDRDSRRVDRSSTKLATEDASVPPKPAEDSLVSLRGRHCRQCLARLDVSEKGRGRLPGYCCTKCKDGSQYIRQAGQVGSIKVRDHHGYAVARGLTLVRWQSGLGRRLQDLAAQSQDSQSLRKPPYVRGPLAHQNMAIG